MRTKLIFILVLLSTGIGNVFGKSDISHDIIVITVCSVPSIILFRNVKKNEINIVPVIVFFADKKYAHVSSQLAKLPKEKIKSIDAAKMAVPVRRCGAVI